MTNLKPKQELEELRQQHEQVKDKLQAENLYLADQVKRLVKAERELYQVQGQLDDQIRLYRQLTEVSKQVNASFELAEILQIVIQFVLYELNFERCLILFRSTESNLFQVEAMDGYYDEDETRVINTLSLPLEEPTLAPLLAGAPQVICPQKCTREALVTLGHKFGMDEYIVLPLGGEPQQPLGLLTAGNTKEMAQFQTRIESDSESILGLINLVGQATTAINNVNFYAALRENEKKYRTLFEDSRDAIFITTPTGEFNDVNQATLDLFGYTRVEMMQLNAQQVYVNPADRIKYQQMLEQTGSVRDYEVQLQKKDGTPMDCLLTATVRRADNGHILAYQGIIRDITERKRQEEAERRLEAYRSSPLGRAETLARSLLRQPETALIELHRLAQTTAQDPDAASLVGHLPRVLEDLGAESLAGLAEGFNYILDSQSAPELLSVGLRILITQLEQPLAKSWLGADDALSVYQLCQTVLETNSVTQITLLLPRLLEQTNRRTGEQLSTANTDFPSNRENITSNLVNALADLDYVAQTLYNFQQVETVEDKVAYLAQSLEALGRLDREFHTSLSQPEQNILGRIAINWLAVTTAALQDLQGRAQLEVSLKTHQLISLEQVTVSLELTNTGRSPASNLTVTFIPNRACPAGCGAVKLDILPAGRSTLIELPLATDISIDQFRAEFTITFDDRERKGKSVAFADMVRLLKPGTAFQPIPNPYAPGTPLRPGSSIFFGRDDLFQFVAENMGGPTRQNILVFVGQRRMGKTSFLQQLPAHLGPEYLPVYLDGQSLGIDPGMVNFFYDLALAIADTLADQGVAVTEPKLEEFRERPSATFERTFLPAIFEMIGSRRLLLLFDEFEELEMRVASGKLEPTIFPFFRHLMQHGDRLGFIFVGTHRLEELTADYWSILFNIALYKRITFLHEAAARALIIEPVAPYGLLYDDLALDKMMRVTAGHPYFLQLICHALVNRANRSQRGYLTIQDVNDVLGEMVELGEAHFAFLWEQANSAERLVLAGLNQLLRQEPTLTAGQITELLVKRGISLDLPALTAALRRLVEQDIVREIEGQPPRYEYKIELVRLWVERYKTLGRVIEEAIE